ncbi:unnamed protein product, partial [Sphenostylis stenocarpa]
SDSSQKCRVVSIKIFFTTFILLGTFQISYPFEKVFRDSRIQELNVKCDIYGVLRESRVENVRDFIGSYL